MVKKTLDDISTVVQTKKKLPVTQGGTRRLSRSLDDVSIPVNPKATTLGDDVNEAKEALVAAKDAIKDMSTSEVIEFLKENGELPGGLGGAVAGTIIGMLIPFPGAALVGGIIGGIIGTSGGSIYSDDYKGEPVDLGKAAALGGESLGWDVGMLGTGKLLKGGAKAVRRLANRGKPDLKAVKEVATDGASLGRTTPPSKGDVLPEAAHSQSIASPHGASLTPSQVGGTVGGRWQTVKENIGRTGFIGKMIFDNNAKQIKQIGQKRMDEIVASGPVFDDKGVLHSIGHGLNEAFNESSEVLIKEYGEAYKSIGNKLSFDRMKSEVVTKDIDGWLNNPKFLTEAGQSKLDDATLEVVNTIRNKFFTKTDGSKMTSFTFRTLLDIEHELNKQVNKFGKFGVGQNTEAARELTLLSKRIKSHNRQLMKKKNPEVAEEFIALQKSYGENMNSIFPKVNQSFLNQAEKGDYASLGRMFLSPQKSDHVKIIMKSIDDSYKVLGKKGAAALPFKTAKEAKDTIRRGYIEGVLPKTIEDPKDLAKFSKLQDVLKNSSDEREKIKLILGDKYTSFKRTVDLLADSSKNPNSGLATLFMRGLEVGAIGGMAGLAYGTDVIETADALTTAAVVLGGPAFLARIATNPKRINELIKLNKLGKTPKRLAAQATILMNKVTDDIAAEGLGEDTMLEAVFSGQQ